MKLSALAAGAAFVTLATPISGVADRWGYVGRWIHRRSFWNTDNDALFEFVFTNSTTSSNNPVSCGIFNR